MTGDIITAVAYWRCHVPHTSREERNYDSPQHNTRWQRPNLKKTKQRAACPGCCAVASLQKPHHNSPVFAFSFHGIPIFLINVMINWWFFFPDLLCYLPFMFLVPVFLLHCKPPHIWICNHVGLFYIWTFSDRMWQVWQQFLATVVMAENVTKTLNSLVIRSRCGLDSTQDHRHDWWLYYRLYYRVKKKPGYTNCLAKA